jgi:hypothetical protein
MINLDDMTFAQAKSRADELWERSSVMSKALDAFCDQFPKGPMNLTPDHVRAMPEYVMLKAAADSAFASMRAFNGPYVKKFKKEIYADTMARRAAKLKAP